MANYSFGGICFNVENVSYSKPGNPLPDEEVRVYYRWFYNTENPADMKYVKTGEANSVMFPVKMNAVLDVNAS